MKKSQKGFSVVEILLVLIAIGLAAGIGWYVFGRSEPTVEPTGQNQSTNISGIRDNTRKEHAIQFATNLFNVYLVQKKVVTIDQSGFDSFSRLGTQKAALDPLTNVAYVFKANQSEMAVGEVTFKLNASCDTKEEGSDGKGLIISGSSQSVAVAIKLESGRFACESNL